MNIPFFEISKEKYSFERLISQSKNIDFLSLGV